MNRIGGPSGLPHSRTCRRSPPPPSTVWILIACSDVPRLLSSLDLLALVGSHRSWPSRTQAAHRAVSLIFGARGSLSSAVPDRRRDTGLMEARASAAFVGRARELEELERALDAAQAGRGATVLVAGRGGDRQDPPRVRARDARARRRLRGPARALARPRRHRAAVPAVRRSAAPARERSQVGDRRAGSQLRVFEETLALLTERAAAAPVLLVLEDLHWADTSTLDLVVFLAHNLADRRVLAARDVPRRRAVVGRADAPARRRRPALGRGARARARAARARRADGAARGSRRRRAAGGADRRDRRPLRRQPVLRRGAARRRATTRARASTRPARPAAAARRPARPPDTEPAARWPRPPDATSATRCFARRRRCPEQTYASRCARPSSTASSSPTRRRGSFRFRHALLAEAIYATILPGEREELHARLADELARSGAAAPAELAPHWAAAGRSAEALAASVEAAREAEAVFGLAEARAHLERALALWHGVPDAAELAGLDLAELCTWTAELASQIGAAPRAVELARRAIELVGDERPAPCGAPARAPRRVPRTRSATNDAALAALERAVELVPARAALAGARVRAGVTRRRADGGLAPRGVAADRASRRSRSPGASAQARRRSGR